MFSFFLFTIQASNFIENAPIYKEKDCFTDVYPEHGKFDEAKYNSYKNTLSCSFFKYSVNGNRVSGYVIKPKVVSSHDLKTKLPVLIFNRGGNAEYGSVKLATMMYNLFPIASEGFVIVGSQYRGISYRGYSMKNSTIRDEFGGKDIDDVTKLVTIIPSIEAADSKRIGMFGHSRGGIQTFLALKKAKEIKAVAITAGASNLFTTLKNRPNMDRVFKSKIVGYAKNKDAELTKRSVIKWVDDLPPKVPVLLLHGTGDKRVSVEQSIELAKAFKKHHIPHKLVLYPDDNHGLWKNKIKANKELVGWFKQYL